MPDKDDRGAVLIVVAGLIVAFLVMAAIAVDLGNAWATKRKLSVAADAAALAAATEVGKIVVEQASGCASGRLTPATAQSAAESQARTTAVTVNGQNDLAQRSTVTNVEVRCSTDENDVQVRVDNAEVVPTFFAPVIGIDNTNPQRSATARVFAPSAGTGLRPIAACTAEVQARASNSDPFLVYLDKTRVDVEEACSRLTTGLGGDWNIVDFTRQGAYGEKSITGSDVGDVCGASGGSATCQEEWLRNGFQAPVYWPNPRSEPFASYSEGDVLPAPADRSSANDPGLASNSGPACGSGCAEALESLTGQTIQVPVAGWLSDDKVAGVNRGDRFFLTNVITVKVCAARFGTKDSEWNATPNASDCKGLSTPAVASGGAYDGQRAWWNGDDPLAKKQRYGLWVEPVSYATISPVGPPSKTCATWDPECTLGTLSLQLFR